MQPEDEKNEAQSTGSDQLLDRILAEAADLVFPEPDDLPEATEQEIDRLMVATAVVSGSGSRRRILFLTPKRQMLALAASLFIIAGVGVFLSTRHQAPSDKDLYGVDNMYGPAIIDGDMPLVHPGFTVAIALPQVNATLRFRGGGAGAVAPSDNVLYRVADLLEAYRTGGLARDELPGIITSGVVDALAEQPEKVETGFRFLDRLLTDNKMDEELVIQISAIDSPQLLYVTTDPVTGELVLLVFRVKTGEKLAEIRLDAAADATQLRKDVSRVVADLLNKGFL